MADKYISEEGLTTLISLTKTELNKKANDASVIKKVNSKAPNASGEVTITATDISGFGKVATSNSYDDLDNKPTIPSKVSQLTNDSKFQTESQVSSAIATAVGKITGFSAEVVTELPTTGENGVIYLVAHTHGTTDKYDEYLWVSTTSTFEKVGNTDIDLSAYLKIADASKTYLTQENASNTYLAKSDATTTYLTKTDAGKTYLTQTNASTTYLSKSDAGTTYLSKTDASTTYLTQANAKTTYVASTDLDTKVGTAGYLKEAGVKALFEAIDSAAVTTLWNSVTV